MLGIKYKIIVQDSLLSEEKDRLLQTAIFSILL